MDDEIKREGDVEEQSIILKNNVVNERDKEKRRESYLSQVP